MNIERFSILYEDDDLVVINKPPGILVHRTPISEDQVFVLQLLRRQLRQRVYPVHRLDRGTSGVLALGKSSAGAEGLSHQFREQNVRKHYLALVRGYLEERGTVDYPLAPEPQREKQRAITHYERLAQREVDHPVGPYDTARYSLLRLRTETGRRHQIRRHCSHLRHPIIGDRRHGDVKHNKFFRQHLHIERMLLHAYELGFYNTKGEWQRVRAPLDDDFERALEFLDFRISPD
ncbi:MAG: pseudouridine synthase [Bacteroidota bacterium]